MSSRFEKLSLAVIMMSAGMLSVPETVRAQTLLGPTPYLSSSDSPFIGPFFSYFNLENFESGALSVPGVTPSVGMVIGPGGGLTDSVDADDGVIDGSGLLGHSFFFADGTVGIR